MFGTPPYPFDTSFDERAEAARRDLVLVDERPFFRGAVASEIARYLEALAARFVVLACRHANSPVPQVVPPWTVLAAARERALQIRDVAALRLAVGVHRGSSRPAAHAGATRPPQSTIRLVAVLTTRHPRLADVVRAELAVAFRAATLHALPSAQAMPDAAAAVDVGLVAVLHAVVRSPGPRRDCRRRRRRRCSRCQRGTPSRPRSAAQRDPRSRRPSRRRLSRRSSRLPERIRRSGTSFLRTPNRRCSARGARSRCSRTDRRRIPNRRSHFVPTGTVILTAGRARVRRSLLLSSFLKRKHACSARRLDRHRRPPCRMSRLAHTFNIVTTGCGCRTLSATLFSCRYNGLRTNGDPGCDVCLQRFQNLSYIRRKLDLFWMLSGQQHLP